MCKDLRKDPVRIVTAVLFVLLAVSCMLMMCSRGLYDFCAGCAHCGGCSCAPDSRNSIDTTGFVDLRNRNNVDLVKWAENACEKEWGYVYGTWGSVLDESLLRTKSAQYIDDVGGNMNLIRRQWMGRRVTDCVGLIKGYCWYDPYKDRFEYCANGMPDIGANSMLETAPESGTIETMPEIIGLAVCAPGHIGVYVGDGWVVEARSTADGVLKTRLEERPWTHWCKIPHIRYIEVETYVLEPGSDTHPASSS